MDDATTSQATEPTTGDIRLVGLTRRFSGTASPAVNAVDLHVRGGEFFSLLGGSGCGKTTTLRMVAGLDEPSSGRILLDDVDVARVPAHRRPVNTVFQNYALFPFMDVAANVAFGLRYLRGAAAPSKAEAAERVRESLAAVRMTEFTGRRPSQLSGGQQQRVALARALVLRPKVLLLDEPLGALDAQLRKALQVELAALQKQVGITFLYVTHDQEEALTMSDRLAVMRSGRIAQVGTPREVYDEPADVGVAAFLGGSNLLGVEVLGSAVASDGTDSSGGTTVRLGPDVLVVAHVGPSVGSAAGSPAVVLVRPERVRLVPADDVAAGEARPNLLEATVERIVYLGASTQMVLRSTGGAVLTATLVNDDGGLVAGLRAGDATGVHLPSDALRLLPGP